jgi:hypothetical protein
MKSFLLSLLLASSATAFLSPLSRHGSTARFSVSTDGLLEEIRSMSVRELKQELTLRKQPTNDVFEKERLVQRLYETRKDGSPLPKKNTSQPSTAASKNNNENILQVPLYLTYMDRNMQVAAVNGGGITLEPSKQPYATIQLSIPGESVAVPALCCDPKWSNSTIYRNSKPPSP